MGTSITKGGPIIAETKDGLVHGREVTVEKPDTCTRVLGGILLATGNVIGALGLDATNKERYVESSDGKLHKVDKVVERTR